MEEKPSQDEPQSHGNSLTPLDADFPKPRWPGVDSRTWMDGSLVDMLDDYGLSLPAVVQLLGHKIRENENFKKTCFDIISGFAIVVMGASGSGKSTVGLLLSKKVPCPFIDADDFHTEENKEKMRNGVPLTEKDRLPWLMNLRDELAKYTSKGEWVVLACSALRPQYRNILLTADQSDDLVDTNTDGSKTTGSTRSTGTVVFAYLEGSVELLASRLDARLKEGKHFMPPSLLQSQLDTLEIIEGDHDIITLDASSSPEEIVDSITNCL